MGRRSICLELLVLQSRSDFPRSSGSTAAFSTSGASGECGGKRPPKGVSVLTAWFPARASRGQQTCPPLLLDPALLERFIDHLVHVPADLVDAEARWTLARRVFLERLKEGGGVKDHLAHEIGVLNPPLVVLV